MTIATVVMMMMMMMMMMMFVYMTPTYQTVATVTQTACRSSRQLVHEKGATVLHPNDMRPLAASTGPTKAHCTLDNPLSHSRVTAI